MNDRFTHSEMAAPVVSTGRVSSGKCSVASGRARIFQGHQRVWIKGDREKNKMKMWLFLLMVGQGIGTCFAGLPGEVEANDSAEFQKHRKRGWIKVYAHNATATLAEGNLAILIDAIQSGADVKVMISSSDDQYQSIACRSVYLSKLKRVVACMNDQGIGGISLEPENFGPDDDAYYAFVMANTEGRLHVSRVSLDDQEPQGSVQSRASMTWYVRYL